MWIIYNMDITKYGNDLIFSQFKNSTNLKKLISIFLEYFQTIDDVFEYMLENVDIETATGEDLKYIGELVGQKWNDNFDFDQNRILIKIKIKSNSSTMSVDETIDMISFAFNGAGIKYYPVKMYPVFCIKKNLEQWEKELINYIPSPLGVFLKFEKYFVPENTFSFAEDSIGLGFGSIDDLDAGGYFASIL